MQRTYLLHFIAGMLLLLPGCQQTSWELSGAQEYTLEYLENRLAELEEAAPEAPEGIALNTYEHYISHKGYPLRMSIFHRDELMAAASAENARIVICLDQQRGRLYVDGAVAADWPVSTGVEGRATTPGDYTVLEKKKMYSSNRFGRIKDVQGKTLVAEADSRLHTTEDGMTWVGSPMPNWMRLTDYGMGMHTGEVQLGKTLSHGCIRMPDYIATRLFDLVEVGFPVTVTDDLEAEFPLRDVLVQYAPYNSWYLAKEKLVGMIDNIRQEAAKAESTQNE